jgi:glycerophosphoryl diester phosphodiesterase
MANKAENQSLENHFVFSGWKNKNRPLVLGHRGGSQKYQENTMRVYSIFELTKKFHH